MKYLIIVMLSTIQASIVLASNGIPSILGAAYSNDVNMAHYYIEHGGNINATSKYGMTALMIAADQCNQKMVKYLLGKGADICIIDNAGYTVLNYACKEETITLVKNQHEKLSNKCLKMGHEDVEYPLNP